MSLPSDLDAEQAFVDRAFACLERQRTDVASMRRLTDDSPGGTFQNRFERDVIVEGIQQRLAQLDVGDRSLVFGRIDHVPSAEAPEGEKFHIGRIAVSDEEMNPVVVDWRARAAEPFYRATGRDPMGLARRRHIASRGRTVLGLDDELFGEEVERLDEGGVVGEGALIAALESARSGRLSDIVATIQSEQDMVIRAPLPGVLVVQGGPGTGKTVVALHRAAYLLYTHRFPLEGQGVLVLGPNRLFLSYIEQVLPSLGEAGVEVAVLGDLVPNIRSTTGDRPAIAAIKGELRMCRLLARAVRDRQRPPRETLVIPSGVERLRVTRADAEALLAHTRRRARSHNAGRRVFEAAFFELLSSKMRKPLEPAILRDRIRHLVEVREALERMWPVLTPAALLNDLFGSRALLRSAGHRWFSDEELSRLRQDRVADPAAVLWSAHDVPLLDEAQELLGPRPRFRNVEMIRTFGHIVVDEAQDLSPMELRMIDRRSLNGSMTIVGDIAQATSAAAQGSWESILSHFDDRRPPRTVELTLGYRLPGPSMRLAARLLPLAAPGLKAPSSIRREGDEPIITATTAECFGADLAAATRRELAAVGSGNVAVICAGAQIDEVTAALASCGVPHGDARRGNLDHQLTVAPIGLVKGLELDACIVIDPAVILESELRGPQALYVALTRATRRLSILHRGPLPEILTAGA